MTLPSASPPPPRSGAAAPRAPDGYGLLEVEVARTADLVLKVHRLLEQAERRDRVPERAERMARMAWLVQTGQVVLRRAAEQAGDAFPHPRAQD